MRPFDLPPRSAIKKPVFAHYFSPFPISMDNKDPNSDYYQTGYLNRDGEKGIHSAYGGYLRDRPLARAPIAGDYKLADMRTEIANAQAYGITGFALELLNTQGTNWDRVNTLIKAAEGTGFQFILTPDMNVDAYKLASEDTVVNALKTLTHPGGKLRPSMWLKDGKVVLNPFRSSTRTPAFWANIKKKYKATTGTDLYLWLSFLNWRAEAPAYKDVADAYMGWGEASQTRNTDPGKHVSDSHAQGKPFMAPIHPFDQRPARSHGLYFDEPNGTDVLHKQWMGAITQGADAAQIVTWNDYTETPNAPSRARGYALGDIHAYYASWFSTGAPPEITDDAIYLLHRSQYSGSVPSPDYPEKMKVRSGTNPPVDLVEVLTFLTAPATVKAGGFTFTCPAGVTRNYIPLTAGPITASAVREVAAVTSPVPVLTKPPVQDMQYYVSSSLR